MTTTTSGDTAALAAIGTATRTLGLPTIRDHIDDHLANATRHQLSYATFLADLLAAECDDRDTRRHARLLHDAGFPRPKRLDTLDYTANPALNPALIGTLARSDWIRNGNPLCLIGDSGTGKTHLLIGLGTAATEHGLRVRYTHAAKLVTELAEAATDRHLARTINRYSRYDLLIIDELGYLTLDTHAAELLFQVITERDERASIATATNEPFSSWTRTFTDPRLCAAIIDRLTYNGTIIETGTTSYRLTTTKAGAKTDRHTGARSA